LATEASDPPRQPQGNLSVVVSVQMATLFGDPGVLNRVGDRR
jgi:hypothetical protein